MDFRTHTGRIVTGDELDAALKTVAQDWRDIAHAIRNEDCYAAHVTEAVKINALQRDLEFADGIERGDPFGFTIWQRVNTVLTGECVALLPK